MSLASLSESFEPMQVDAEENDNDEVEGVEGAANGPLMVDLTGVGGGAAGLKQVLLESRQLSFGLQKFHKKFN